MKKIICILLTLMLCLSVAGCGEKEVAVGEKVVTDKVEFTVTNHVFHRCLSNFDDETFLLPVELTDDDAPLQYVKNNPYYTDTEHVMLMVEYEYKNTGTLNIAPIDSFTIVFNNDQTFEAKGYGQRSNGSFGSLPDIQPSGDKIIARATVELPAEVLENDEEPVVIKIRLPGTKKETTIKLR